MKLVGDMIMDYKMLKVAVDAGVGTVTLNRPEKANALNERAWQELEEIFYRFDEDTAVRVVILNGAGTRFCAGIDLSLLMALRQHVADECEGRTREKMRRMVKKLQAPISAIEACCKPVIAAVQGACVGGGVDIITACDMRYGTEDAFFSIAEIDMGMVADLGTLQRLPKIIPDGVARELAYTGRRMVAAEAVQVGLLNAQFATQEEMETAVSDIAQTIASKSPLSIRGTKEMLNFTRDHSVAEGLNYIATWNAAMILSEDLNEAFAAKMGQRTPSFRD